METKSVHKAVNPRNQAALDEFCKNEFWRSEYENAPECMKELLEDSYYASLNYEKCLKDRKEHKESSWDEDKMTIEQIRYLAKFGWHPMMRSHYKQVLERRLAASEGKPEEKSK